MGKHKNTFQETIFLKFMRQHRNFAKGLIKGDRGLQEELWSKLVRELNAAGPPKKDASTWKKNWGDWKANIKRKLDRLHGLSRTEEEIANICRLFTPVNEITGEECKSDMHSTSSNVSDDDVLCTSKSPIPEKNNISLSDNVEYVLEDVTELTEKQYNNLNCINKNLEKIQESMAKQAKSIEGVEQVLKQMLDETKRHNRQMEKNLTEKNQIKLRLLELEKIQLGLKSSK